MTLARPDTNCAASQELRSKIHNEWPDIRNSLLLGPASTDLVCLANSAEYRQPEALLLYPRSLVVSIKTSGGDELVLKDERVCHISWSQVFEARVVLKCKWPLRWRSWGHRIRIRICCEIYSGCLQKCQPKGSCWTPDRRIYPKLSPKSRTYLQKSR